MNHTVLFLFAIPTLGIIIIVVHQFWDEMFKKKFIIERRAASAALLSAAETEALNRRFSDSRVSIGPSRTKTESSSPTDASAAPVFAPK